MRQDMCRICGCETLECTKCKVCHQNLKCECTKCHTIRYEQSHQECLEKETHVILN